MSANWSPRPPVCHELRATPDTCFWGFFDSARPPVLEVRSGDLVRVETLMYRGIPMAERGLWPACTS